MTPSRIVACMPFRKPRMNTITASDKKTANKVISERRRLRRTLRSAIRISGSMVPPPAIVYLTNVRSSSASAAGGAHDEGDVLLDELLERGGDQAAAAEQPAAEEERRRDVHEEHLGRDVAADAAGALQLLDQLEGGAGDAHMALEQRLRDFVGSGEPDDDAEELAVARIRGESEETLDHQIEDLGERAVADHGEGFLDVGGPHAVALGEHLVEDRLLGGEVVVDGGLADAGAGGEGAHAGGVEAALGEQVERGVEDGTAGVAGGGGGRASHARKLNERSLSFQAQIERSFNFAGLPDAGAPFCAR